MAVPLGLSSAVAASVRRECEADTDIHCAGLGEVAHFLKRRLVDVDQDARKRYRYAGVVVLQLAVVSVDPAHRGYLSLDVRL